MHFINILVIPVCCCISSISAVPSLEVSYHDLMFPVSENGTFSVFTSHPYVQSLTVWFNYSDDHNLLPLPEDRVIGAQSTERLEYTVQAEAAGHCTVTVGTTPDVLKRKDAFVRVGVYKSHGWVVMSSVVGWFYFILWSISFYPQIIENFRRKSVIGLNFDLVALNLTGFIAYSVFNIGLRFIREVQLEYHFLHPTGVIPVEINDVVFAVGAVFATVITVIQCFIYERGKQKLARSTVFALALTWVLAAVFLLLTALRVNKYTPWLTFLYFFSYVKLGVTATKYIPQVVLNYRRKSTTGWSIGTVMCDVSGGLFSIGQMFIISYNFNDWYSLIGNFTKFGLALASIFFDFVFMIQHFYLYRKEPDVSFALEQTV